MRLFKITPKIEVACESERTRYGFRHLATLLIDGNEQEKAKACYYNRTWESYEFQSVLLSLINKSKVLTTEEKEVCKKFANGDHTDWSAFKMTSAIAQLGDLLCDNQKDKNDWKARMLRAGLGNKGLDIPADWDSLDETTKESRLNLVIEELSSKGQETKQ
jgi:hypothetical protein